VAIKTVTFASTLMYKAKQVGKAKIAGDPEEIAKAEAALEEYEALVLASDEMLLDSPDYRPKNYR
jgi:hypothetical protein